MAHINSSEKKEEEKNKVSEQKVYLLVIGIQVLWGVFSLSSGIVVRFWKHLYTRKMYVYVRIHVDYSHHISLDWHKLLEMKKERKNRIIVWENTSWL